MILTVNRDYFLKQQYSFDLCSHATVLFREALALKG
jgi:hypothetical protein